MPGGWTKGNNVGPWLHITHWLDFIPFNLHSQSAFQCSHGQLWQCFYTSSSCPYHTTRGFPFSTATVLSPPTGHLAHIDSSQNKLLILSDLDVLSPHADAPPLPWPLQAAHFPDGGLLIRDTLLAGTAIAICNGSYMPTRFPHLAALAWILHPGPSSPGIPRHGMTQVHSWPQVINSYQVEWQGLYMLLLALEHICTLHQIQLSSITIGCDNKGVLHHAHHPSTNIPCVFKHADLIQAVHALQQQCPVHLAFQYVVGHQEDFV